MESIKYKVFGMNRLMVNNISKNYGILKKKVVLNKLSLEVNEGNCVCIVGKNGAGKSTLLKIICGLIPPTEGKIEITKFISYVPELSIGYKELNAIENLSYYDKIMEYTGDYKKWVTNFNLADNSSQLKFFSKGMKRKVDLIRALNGRPKLIVMDEPFEGLDPSICSEVILIIRDLIKSNVSVLLTSHSMDYIEKVATSILLLKNGQLTPLLNWESKVVLRISGNLDTLSNSPIIKKLERLDESTAKITCDRNDLVNLMGILLKNGFEVSFLEQVDLGDLIIEELKNDKQK